MKGSGKEEQMVLVFWQISDHKDFASILEDEKRHRALRDEKESWEDEKHRKSLQRWRVAILFCPKDP